MNAEAADLLRLRRGDQIVTHEQEPRFGPRVCSNIFEHALDAGAHVLRSFLGIEDDGRFHEFVATKEGAAMLAGFKAYAEFELRLDQTRIQR